MKLREAARLNEEPNVSDESPSSAQAAASSSPNLAASSVAQQERDFQKAVQPGSPISILIQSAKQPFLVAPRDTESLIKKLTAPRDRETGELLNKRGSVALKSIKEGKEPERESTIPGKTRSNEHGKVTTVENQKARIVAQMTANFPSGSPAVTDDEGKAQDGRKAYTLQSSSSGRAIPTRSSE
jgi:cell cycle serine/threonine-protein kinase CDC5/MSD2